MAAKAQPQPRFERTYPAIRKRRISHSAVGAETLAVDDGGTRTMAKRVLLVGLRPNLVEGFRQQLDLSHVEFDGASDVDDVAAAFARTDFDHVFLGGGLDLSVRLAAIQLVFESSDKATVHLKDHLSGPEGFVPFARAVLHGLAEYEPRESPQAILRAHPRNEADAD